MTGRELVRRPGADRLRVSWWDRLLIAIAPDWGLRRVRARATAQLLERHYEAAQVGRRTAGWQRFQTDANTANGPALPALRELSRDLHRNNGWAQSGIETIVNNTVGWGILPKPKPGRARARAAAAIQIWNDWADTKACDFDGQLNFYGLQRLAMQTVALSGEVFVVAQPATTADGLPVPIRLQLLEPDHLDTSRSGLIGPGGGEIIDGVEFDTQGHRVAYWLFTKHPGGRSLMPSRFESVRTPADRVLHIYRVDRPGQVRGVPWLASAIAKIKDLDDLDDADLLQKKVAACFGAFVTDMDGNPSPIGVKATDADGNEIDELEPGHIAYLPAGRQITFAQPPATLDGTIGVRSLRRIAAGLGVTYEDLTSDYSNVNFSSARMARLSHWQRVRVWRWQMLIPGLCEGVWKWVMELAAALEGWPSVPGEQWAAPPMPILEPDREGLAYQRLIRNGLMTWSQAVSELGEDPVEQLDAIEELNKELDKRGIVLDIDPRKTTAAGQQQAAVTPKPATDADASAEADEDSADAEATGAADPKKPPR